MSEGHSRWLSRNRHITYIRYAVEHLRFHVFYDSKELDREYKSIFGHESTLLYPFQVISRMSLYLRDHISKEFLSGMNFNHPIIGRNCTFGLVSPFTGKLEWISVDCSRKYFIPTLICEKPGEKPLNVTYVVYVNSSDNSESDYILNNCPAKTHLIACGMNHSHLYPLLKTII